mmetsp:Transcript_32032/g.38795  ORF Transcript_32032/g.38795 Transcript_32032/m.38795 type:complete len:241 (-) Transcript_32032:262-984(-)|eukprot:CAMPEP_0197853724 /NCGR_PEP_ID=MMETSP1438-20131217/23283_1 /TAXON_ID=1461541 /ORGANISM="Pterosperma sp., Strain CCMP1384" /LENGTH=240 /DNA_ID=CAMNT_0043468231 /DNA_START=145 /DNA_END=867 /DNA_ORIENTATION=+
MEKVEEFQKAISDTVQSIKNKPKKEFDRVSASVTDTVDDTIKSVSTGAHETLNTLQEKGFEQAEVAKGYASVLSTQEEKFFSSLKGVVYEVAQYPYAAAGVTAGAALLLLPGPRGFLFRKTFGKLRSEEGIATSVERKLQTTKDLLGKQELDVKKAEEALANAQKEYNDKKAALKSVKKEVQALASDAAGQEKACKSMLYTLREISGKKAVELRSEVAVAGSMAAYQRSAMEKALRGSHV